MSPPYHYDFATDKVLSNLDDKLESKSPSDSERWAFFALEEQKIANSHLRERLFNEDCECSTESLPHRIYDDLSFITKAALIVAIIFFLWGNPSPASIIHNKFMTNMTEEIDNKAPAPHQHIRTVTAQEFQDNFDDIIEGVKNGEHVKITDGLTSAVIVSETEFNLLKNGFASIAE